MIMVDSRGSRAPSHEGSRNEDSTKDDSIAKSTSASEMSDQAKKDRPLAGTDAVVPPISANDPEENTFNRQEESPEGIKLTEEDVTSETGSDLRQRLGDDFDVLRRDFSDDVRRRGRKQAPERIDQFSQYLRIMENRLNVLERIAKVRWLGDASKDEASDAHEAKFGSDCLIAGIRRCNTSTFAKLIE